MQFKFKISKKKIITVLLFVYLLFIKCWERVPYIGILFSHFDEILTLTLMVYNFVHIKLLLKQKHNIVYCWIMFWIIGLVSTLVHHYQGIIPSMIDGIIIINRFVVAYFFSTIYFRKYNSKIVLEKIYGISKIITIILFFFSVHDAFFTPFFSTYGYEFGMNVQGLMFGHPTYLAIAAISLLIYFTYIFAPQKGMIYKVMLTFISIVTFRAKAIAFIFVYWILFIYFFILKQKRVLIIGGVAVFLSFIIGREKLIYYFVGGASFSPRLVMLKDGMKLAMQNMPLGTGFATFGSSIAAKYYSPLYNELGYTLLDGMGRDGITSYLSDSFWPCIMAQFGFLGMGLFVISLSYLFISALIKFKVNPKTGYCMLAILVYLGIVSFAETSFFNPAAFLLAILFGAFENHREVGGVVPCRKH